jgi:hypothetical protein
MMGSLAIATAASAHPPQRRESRLFFAFHGDVRPAACDDAAGYPTPVIEAIFRREAALGAEFAVDLGDHMYVCNGTLDEARAQMGHYLDAAKLLGAPTYMTMGNHECRTEQCAPGSNDPNFVAFSEALAPTSDRPWYRVDVPARGGIAAIVVIADSAWDEAQARWLEATLADAERAAKYVIVVRHHPAGDTLLHTVDEWAIIARHRYTLLLAGHSHQYRHDVDYDPSGRSLRLGLGGGPLDEGARYFGFGTVEQNPDDSLTVKIHDVATGQVEDAFTVAATDHSTRRER